MSRVTLDKNCSTALLNFVRCVGLTMTREVRPIGFTAGSTSTVLEIDDSVEEDMTEFINNVCSCRFVSTKDTELLVWSGTYNSVLQASSIHGEVTSLTERELLHSLQPGSVTIYFRNTNGAHTADDNRQFLKENGISSNSIVCVSSRHSKIDAYRFAEVSRNGDQVVYDVDIRSEYGTQFDDLVKLASTELMKLGV